MKKNKILIGCLALLLALSVGYALFSDTITINGTATAKGNFELTTTCDMDQDAINKAFGTAANGVAERGQVTDAKISCDANIVNASATLGYPGSEKWFRVMVKNTGTIPARLTKVVELNNPEFYIFEEGNAANMIENIKGDSNNYASSMILPGISWVDDYSTSDGTVDIAWFEEQLYAVLDPGETAYFYIVMNWAYSSTTPGETLVPSLNVKMTWEQVTN